MGFSGHRNRSILAVLVFCACFPVSAGQYAASFLEIGVGARALGMGGAFCSLADDGQGFYWNPAGMALLKRPRLSGMYGPQFGTLGDPLARFHFIGYAQPLPGDVLVSMNWIRLSVDDIPVYSGLEGNSYLDRLSNRSLRPDGEPEGFLQDTEDAFIFSFSKRNEWIADLGWLYHKMRLDLPMGINIKWIRQSLGDYSATGLGLDVGGLIRCHLDDFFQTEKLGILAVGIHVQDATRTTLRWRSKHQDAIPRNVKTGVSYQSPLPLHGHFLTIAADHDTRWGGNTHLGLEYRGFGVLALRAGSDGGNFTGGAGLHIKAVEIDYAFLSHSLDSLHRLSCAIVF
jgi:hypothetical protein